MRAIVQRVAQAKVVVDGDPVGEVSRGLLIYLGIAQGDGSRDVEFMARKIRFLRIFEDEQGRMNLDVAQVGGSILVVSNFTLQADTRQGRRPAFTPAAAPEEADQLYQQVCGQLAALGVPVQTGRFGARMAVYAENEGPVNIWLDSRETSAAETREAV